MDSLALASSIKSLERSADSLSGWLTFFTALVVIGLILEYWKDVTGIFRSFEWPKLRAVIGGILVTVGGAGELFIGFRASTVETKLRSANAETFASLNKEAGEARKTAADISAKYKDVDLAIAAANARADEATARVKGAEAQIASANAASRDAVAKVSTAQARIAEAEARAAEARSMAEQERLERVRLEAQIAPRRLTAPQVEEIARAVQRFSGRNVSVVSYSLDLEAAVLGQLIEAALKSGGLHVQANLASVMPFGGFLVGIHVNGPASQQDLVTALSVILRADGGLVVALDAPTNAGAGIESGGTGGESPAVVITVGVKPLAPAK